jgi:hypothetical protein
VSAFSRLVLAYAGPPKPYAYQPEKTTVLIPDPPYAIEMDSPYLDSIDGIPWHDAPVPARLHACWPQTRGFGTSRCACGAIRTAPWDSWLERNSR